MIARARPGQLAMLALLQLTACSEDPVVSTVTLPPNLFQTAISEPIHGVSEADSNSGGSEADVYVAFPVGGLPGIRAVRISNITARIIGTTSYAVIDGALDPVAISAAVGDTLELSMTTFDGAIALLRAAVPARRPPRVIRTDPPKGRTDIGLNSKILVVFSEPVDPATITDHTLRLTLAGQPVAGSFVLGGRPVLTAEFVPARPLLALSTYQVAIGGEIRDLSGDPLEEPVTIEFRTGVGIPSGAKIVFVSERDGNSEIYAANEDGSGQNRVTFNSAADLSPAWSPDGRRLAFASDRSGAWEIYIMNADGSSLVQRTNAGFRYARGPAWSPDGRKIAFGGNCDSDNVILCINVISADPDGSDPVQLGRAYRYNSDPAWSPDGSEIAFVSDRDAPDEGVYDIFVTKADGSRLVQLTRGSASPGPTEKFSQHPDYSRDGRIALLSYDGYLHDDTVDLTVMNADGTGFTIITTAGTVGYWGIPHSLTWSPDGSSIAFTSGLCSDHAGHPCSYSIEVVKADGSDKRILINDGHSPTWRR